MFYRQLARQATGQEFSSAIPAIVDAVSRLVPFGSKGSYAFKDASGNPITIQSRTNAATDIWVGSRWFSSTLISISVDGQANYYADARNGQLPLSISDHFLGGGIDSAASDQVKSVFQAILKETSRYRNPNNWQMAYVSPHEASPSLPRTVTAQMPQKRMVRSR